MLMEKLERGDLLSLPKNSIKYHHCAKFNYEYGKIKKKNTCRKYHKIFKILNDQALNF